jgi:hypothetical protein
MKYDQYRDEYLVAITTKSANIDLDPLQGSELVL